MTLLTKSFQYFINLQSFTKNNIKSNQTITKFIFSQFLNIPNEKQLYERVDQIKLEMNNLNSKKQKSFQTFSIWEQKITASDSKLIRRRTHSTISK